MPRRYYSIAAARRSLVFFVFGKAGAAISGLAVLLLILRMAPVDAFGAYVALMAATEIFYIASGLGLSYFAQRYVPELRIRASAAQFNRQLWRLMATRVALAAVFALLVWLAVSHRGAFLDVSLSAVAVALFVANLVLGSIMRYIDELFQALLLQGWAQIQSVVRNLVRLAALAWGALEVLAIDLNFLLIMEVCVGVLAVLTGAVALAHYMAKSPAERSDATAHHELHGAMNQSLKFYFAQILAQGYGPNAMKLLVTLVVGVHGTAALGFAQSLADLLRNYSPAFLLGGWVRPLMVARYVENPSASVLKPLTCLVVSLSIVGLLPFAVIFAVFGHEVALLMAGGKYPEAVPLLAPLVGIVCVQAVHAVFGMVCATIERTSFVLVATAVCITTLPLAYFLTSKFGLAGTVAALFLGEMLWVSTVSVQLVALFGKADFADVRGLARALLIAVVLGVALGLVHHIWPLVGTARWASVAVVASALYWMTAWYGRVFSVEQRALLGKLFKRSSASPARTS